MRIIGGEYRRRRIQSPPENAQTRPIPDRTKESLFNLLRGNVEGATVVDVFAGTGPIGLEAVSRGAASCTFVEKDRRVADVLRQNIAELGCDDRCQVVVADALGVSLEHRLPDQIDLLFFDPPYVLMEDERAAARVLGQFGRLIERLSPEGFAVLRTPRPYLVGAPPDRRPGPLQVAGAIGPECHPYGSTALQLYMRERANAGDAGGPPVQSPS